MIDNCGEEIQEILPFKKQTTDRQDKGSPCL